MSYCGYCHDYATYFCNDTDAKCSNDESRRHQCKRCAMDNKFICPYCGSDLVEEDELWSLSNASVKKGERFYSEYFKSYGTVTKYLDEDNWWFKLDGWLKPEMKARVRPTELIRVLKKEND